MKRSTVVALGLLALVATAGGDREVGSRRRRTALAVASVAATLTILVLTVTALTRGSEPSTTPGARPHRERVNAPGSPRPARW